MPRRFVPHFVTHCVTRRLAACSLLLALLSLGAALRPAAAAAVLNVPAAYPTIQAAIGAAQNGDTVLLADGTYTGPGNVDVDFGGRNVTVASQNGAATTIIDCGGGGGASHRGFTLHSGETGAVLSGLTIQNGSESGGYGGGVSVFGSAVALQNCVFLGNTALFGGGLSAQQSQVSLSGCVFRGNTAQNSGPFTAQGGGLLVSYGGATLTNCVFSGNASYFGGGVANGSGGTLTLTNCTLTGNSASSGVGGGFYNGYGGPDTLTNDVLYGDADGEIGGSGVTASFCDVQGGAAGTGDVNADPLFFSATDLHLQAGSPCLGAGTASGAPATTIDGRTRPNPPSIGAYEAGLTGTAATTTTVTSSLNPSVYGQFVTFTATVSGAGATPTGTVTFLLDGVAQAHAGLSGGSAADTTTALTAGAHTVAALYSGDAAYGPGKSAAITQTVSLAPTTTTLKSSLNPAAYGQPVSLTATVSGGGGQGGGRDFYPTGAVTFTDTTSGATLGTGTLSWGTATLSTSSLAVGTHQIVASYGGSSGAAASSSAALAQVVSALPSTAGLTSSVNPSLAGQPVTFTAAVSGAGPTPTGTVTVTLDGAAQTPLTLSNGSAAFSPAPLGVGTHTLTAAYGGDAVYTSSASPMLTQTVNAHVSPQYVSPSGSDANAGTQASPRLTLQAAISATLSGDTVIVEDGTYTGPGDVDLDFGGKSLTVTSQNGAATTIIDCGGSSAANHRGFNLYGSGLKAVLSGLTIQNGYESGDGGGILNASSGLTLQSCLLRNNAAASGGGLGLESQGSGSGGPAAVTDCAFVGNSATSGAGGGLFSADSNAGTLTVTGCTFTGNAAPTGGGVDDNLGFNGGTVALTDDILYGDTGGETGGAAAKITAAYCDVQGGYAGTGNIAADPRFVSAADLHLQAGSPCLGAGSGAPATTLDGRTRPSPPAIGAYEATLAGTALTVSNASGVPGQTVTLAATLKKAGGAALAGRTLTFRVDGTAVGTALTNSGGVASRAFALPGSITAGGHALTVSFAGDGTDAGSSGAATLTVSPAGTTLSVAAASGAPGQTVTLKATLKRTVGGAVLANAAVSFSVDGTAVGSAVTNAAGLAVLSYTVPAGFTAGSSHPVRASFGGDAGDTASAGTSTLTVSRSASALSVAAASGAPGWTVTLSATLKSGAAALPGKTVTFTVDGAAVGSAVTDSSGLAALPYAVPAGAAPGGHPVTAAFAGDAAFLPATGKGTLTVKPS